MIKDNVEEENTTNKRLEILEGLMISKEENKEIRKLKGIRKDYQPKLPSLRRRENADNPWK